MNTHIKQFVVAIACVLIASTCSLADWPFYRGDERATGTVAEAVPDQIEVLWKKTIPESAFEATPVIAKGMIYLGDIDGTFYAYRLADGELEWKKSFPDCGFLAGATFANDRLFVGDYNGVVRALDASSGELLWKTELLRAEVYAPPNVVEGHVLVTSESGELASFDSATGKHLWTYEIEAPLRCWPTVVEGNVLLAGCDGRLHVVDVTTGKETAGIDIDGPTGSTPAIMAGNALFGTEQGSFYSIQQEPLEIKWRYFDPQHAQGIRTAAAVTEQAIVYGTQGRRVVAIQPEAGEIIWDFTTRSDVESSPVIVGDSVFVATKRGVLHRFNLADGKEQWQYIAGGGFQGSFAVTDGKLVIGSTDGTLYCLGK